MSLSPAVPELHPDDLANPPLSGPAGADNGVPVPTALTGTNSWDTDTTPNVIANNVSQAKDLAVGVSRGVANTVAGVGEMAQKIPAAGKLLAPASAVGAYRRWSQPANPAQAIGRQAEQIGEYMVPGFGEEKAVLTPVRMALQAAISGIHNKAQGGNFMQGAAASMLGPLAPEAEGLTRAVTPARAVTPVELEGEDLANEHPLAQAAGPIEAAAKATPSTAIAPATLGQTGVPAAQPTPALGKPARQITRQGVPELSSTDDIAATLRSNAGKELYVRRSAGPSYDTKQQYSRDYQTGELHAGLSAVEIDPTWVNEKPQYMLKRLSEYHSNIPYKGKTPRLWIYEGSKVGEDSDGQPVISIARPVAVINHDLSALSPKTYLQSLIDDARAKAENFSGRYNYDAVHLKEYLREARARGWDDVK